MSDRERRELGEHLSNLGGCKTIREYVAGKLERLRKETPEFPALFRMMFSETDNVFYERSGGFGIQKTTYGEAKAEIKRRAVALNEFLQGQAKNSVVGLYMGNSLSWLLNYWAILAAGFCPLLMNLRLDRKTLEEALTGLQAVAVISDGEAFGPLLITEETLAAKAKEYGENGVEEQNGGEGSFGDTFYMMSSGTGGHVKICAYTAAELCSILSDSEHIVRDNEFIKRHYHGELKLLTFLPFYHIFGFVAVYLWFGFFQRTFVELRDYAPETILGTIRRHEVTHVFAVPLFWNKIYAAALSAVRNRGEKTVAKFEKGLALSAGLEKFPALQAAFARKAFREVREKIFGDSISFLISGGGPIPREVLAFFNRIGYHMANGYGMSEIGIAAVNLSARSSELETGSVGKPLSSYAFRVENGELWVSGESRAAFVLTDGVREERPDWFPTGDLAECRDGNYFITGRSDDLIVDATGENLNPNLVEEKLSVPGVRGVALSAAQRSGETEPVLIAEIPPYLPEDVLAKVESRLHDALRETKLTTAIHRIVFTEEPLIHADEFKLNRRRIKAELETGTFPERKKGTSESPADGDALSKKLSTLFAEALNKDAEKVGRNTDFFTEEGGNSLDYLMLLSKIRETFGVSLKVSSDNVLRTLDEIEAEVRKRIGDVDQVL